VAATPRQSGLPQVLPCHGDAFRGGVGEVWAVDSCRPCGTVRLGLPGAAAEAAVAAAPWTFVLRLRPRRVVVSSNAGEKSGRSRAGAGRCRCSFRVQRQRLLQIGLVSGTSMVVRGKQIRRGCPVLSAVGGGSGVGSAPGLSPADVPQRIWLRCSSANHLIGHQSADCAKRCSSIHVRWRSAPFLSGGFGGVGDQWQAVRLLSFEVSRDLIVIFSFLEVLFAVVLLHVSLLYPSGCLCVCTGSCTIFLC
jgi:hypothetical protein